MFNLKRHERLMDQLCSEALKDAETHYNENGKFSCEVLQCLHSVFGSVFALTTDLLDRCKIVQYTTKDRLRNINILDGGNDQYAIFDDINYCRCDGFTQQVLTCKTPTCKHVLAVKLARITKTIKEELVTESQLIELLNNQTEDRKPIDAQ